MSAIFGRSRLPWRLGMMPRRAGRPFDENLTTL